MSQLHGRPADAARLRRIPTRVPGLDTVLGGGLVGGGLYLIEGVPGAGKTILASQIAFAHARDGAGILVISLIAESHAKCLAHLRELAFYDERMVGRGIVWLSGLGTLIADGLPGLLGLIAESMTDKKPALLVVDGFAAARELGDSTRALATFIHELNSLAGTWRCTTLLLAPIAGNVPRPEHTLVDGLIELQRPTSGLRRGREIEVHKLRGGRHLTGRHVFVIDRQGVRVYPRLESLVMERHIEPGVQWERLPTGIRGLDALAGGGLVRGSATSLLGAPGSGKTLAGLSFLAAGVERGEPGLYFGTYETPDRLVAKAQKVGLALGDAVREGTLYLEWRPPMELLLDELAHDIEVLVSRHQVRRVFIDGVEGFCQAAMHPERQPQFLTALTVLLRQLGVTTLLSEELPIYAAGIDTAALSISALVENIILMRYFEQDAVLHRLLSIIKLRESDFDPGIRELHITEHGLEVGDRPRGVRNLLTGRAGRAASASSTDEPRDG